MSEPTSPTTSKGNCCSFVNLNPKNWAAKDVAKASITVFVIAVLALTTAALTHKYPAAAGAFFTIFSVATAVSIIVFGISCNKCRKQQKSTNPFDENPPSLADEFFKDSPNTESK